MVLRKRSFVRPDDLRRGTPRAVRSEVTRAALIDAAGRTVGQLGYADATVARITELAGVGQGTFYNYFSSRQELLDQILPRLSDEMLLFVKARVGGIQDPMEREEQQFRAFFDFLVERPEFFRVLHEAEQFAPNAYREHHAKVEAGYVRWFKRLKAQGHLRRIHEPELKVVAHVLMAARDYIAMQFELSDGKRARPVPEEVVTGYMKLVRFGLSSGK
jgi:AcrR family transcriptional regulator